LPVSASGEGWFAAAPHPAKVGSGGASSSIDRRTSSRQPAWICLIAWGFLGAAAWVVVFLAFDLLRLI